MKKIMIIALCAILGMGAVNAQNLPTTLTDNEIANIIAKSKEANAANGISDPNLIFPGQTLTFLFENGTSVEYPVSTGDNQWAIVKRVLIDSQKHGDVVNYTPEPKPTVAPVNPEPTTSNTDWYWWVLLAALLGLYMLYRAANKYKNPVNAGPAFRQGGIEYGSQNEHENVSREFQRQYGEPMTNIRRCLISTVGNSRVPVRFADNTTQNLLLRNERGYEGTTANGERRYILGGCANGFALQNHMRAENLSIEYISDVPAPQQVTETPTQHQQPQPQELVQMVTVLAGTVGQMQNGGNISLIHSELKLNITVNPKPNTVASLNGAHTEKGVEAEVVAQQ